MVDGEDRSTLRPLRPAAPLDGPLAESGAAPDPASRLPRPRRPWLRSETPAEPASAEPASVEPASAEPASAEPASVEPAGDAGRDADATGAGSTTDADGPAGDRPGDTKTDAGEVTAPAATSAAGQDAGTGPTVDATPDPAVGAAVVPEARSRRHRVPFAHAVRLGPRGAAVAAARATRAWSRRPSGRLTLPGVFLLALVAATAAAGALVVPAAIRSPRPVAIDATAEPSAPPAGLPTGALPSTPPSGLPGVAVPTTAPPTGVPPTGTVTNPLGGRPSDALAGWASQVGPKVGIAPVAMQAYGYAELVLAQTNRSCALSWTTLAAIGFVESGHGQANGATLGQDGRATPEIIGLPLDGRDGRMRIIDTDRGEFDRDTTFDRAIGPMQFIPTTWKEIGTDADNDGRKDPHDLDDAALSAANYLCKSGRNLSIPADWWNAILSYNDVRRYAQKVFDTANQYGQASRT
ncbi:lytic murein transglycosylase [Micromonospora costi]|uniref:lytic transglycosylase domain-containing protein n=1 Tax=Micromonospora costi TaxID=1530042 RepID=UPI00340D9026